MSIVQFILPPIYSGAKGSFKIETRIQKSRTPRTQNVVGIWSAGTTYNINSGIADVVYYNGVSYPGWQTTINANLNNTPPISLAAWQSSPSSYDWIPASNFEFIQSDQSTVFYLDQQIIAKGGLGKLMRSVSRQQGLTTPDARALKFIDYTRYSGQYLSTYGTNIGLTDLSTTAARSLLNLIFDDPDAFYTFYFSRCTDGMGSHSPANYTTDRELFSIGDADYAKLVAPYAMDYRPGTTSAVQKMAAGIPAESVGKRLNTFTVGDLVLTIDVAQDLFSGPQPFLGGLVLLGAGPPPTFPQYGNKFPLNGFLFGDVSNFIYTQDTIRFHASRSQSRGANDGCSLNGSRTDTSFSDTGYRVQQNVTIPATTSVNDGLHAISLLTILAKIAALVNFSWNNSTDLTTLLSFWLDGVPQAGALGLTSTNIALLNVFFCYEYLFNLDPRCDVTLAGTPAQTGTQMTMAAGFSRNTPLGDVLKRIVVSLITYVKSTYDQTNFRAENQLLDAITPSGNPIPTNWQMGNMGGIKPRIQSALNVTATNTGYNDSMQCPNAHGATLPVVSGFRVKKQGILGGTNLGQACGDSTTDLIQNNALTQQDQWKTFQPMNGGLNDGGHVIGAKWQPSGYVSYVAATNFGTNGNAPDGTAIVPSGSFQPASSSYTAGGRQCYITDDFHEFVIAQGSTNGGQWTGLQSDAYGGAAYANYLTPAANGNADTVCVWAGTSAGGSGSPACLYGATIGKTTRNQLWFSQPDGAQNGQLAVAGAGGWPANLPYVIGYNGFGLDLTVTDGSADIISAGYDFYNFDALGNGHIGQQIIIPQRGIFTIISVNAKTGSTFNGCTLDRPIIGSGTNLEFRIGGPTMNPQSFVIGTYLYTYCDGSAIPQVFGPTYNENDCAGSGDDWASFFPSMFLGPSGSVTDNFQGFYALSRMRYVDGLGYDGPGGSMPTTNFNNAPDDSYGNSLKTFAQCRAALDLGSFQLVGRNAIGLLDDMGSMLGYGPLDTFAEHSQGADRTYKAQTLGVGEREGTIDIEFLESTNPKAINDTNYPVIPTTGGGGGNGGGGGGIGGIGGGGGGGSSPTNLSQTLSVFSVTQNNLLVNTNTGFLYVSSSVNLPTTPIEITGIVGGSTGRVLVVTNISTGDAPIIFPNQSGSSLAANQFLIQGAGSRTIFKDGSISFLYDGATKMWRELTTGG